MKFMVTMQCQVIAELCNMFQNGRTDKDKAEREGRILDPTQHRMELI